MFCLTIAWLEAVYEKSREEPVWVWEADEDSGKLVLLGRTDLCHDFHREIGNIIANNPETEEWR